MSNPVFDRINKSVDGYAQFGGPRTQQTPPPAYGQYGRQPMSPTELQDLYARPSAGPVQTGRVTADDVVMKFAGLFAILLVGAAVSGFVLPRSTAAVLILPAILVTLVLGLVIAFKKTISVPLIVTYAALEGVLVGGVSRIYADAFGPGVVSSAIIATLSVFAGMFLAYRSGLIKVTDKFRRFMMLAIVGYLIFAMANLVAAMFGGNSGWGFFAFGSPLSIGVSLLAVGLASFSLAMDFDSIDRAVAAGAPQKMSWLLAHGLVVTVVWLYLELLRLIAQFSSMSRD